MNNTHDPLPLFVSSLVSKTAVNAINAEMGRITRDGFKPVEFEDNKARAYRPRPAEEIAAEILRIAEAANNTANARQLGRATQAAQKNDGELRPEIVLGARHLPSGRYMLPAVSVSSGTLMLLARAAQCYGGWAIEKFVLDAAVCRAQALRDECARRHVPFGYVTADSETPAEDGPPPASPETAADKVTGAEAPNGGSNPNLENWSEKLEHLRVLDDNREAPNPDLRVTHGRGKVPYLKSVPNPKGGGSEE